MDVLNLNKNDMKSLYTNNGSERRWSVTNDIATIIINQVEKLKNLNKNIKFIWTPGHCKINGNK